MTKSRVTRRQLLVAAAPAVAAVPLAKLALSGSDAHAGDHAAAEEFADHARLGHAAMVGDMAPAVGGPNDLDGLLYPPAALPAEPGRVREYEITAFDRDLEIYPGITFAAWTYNGTVPGPIVRATEGDLLRVNFTNGG